MEAVSDLFSDGFGGKIELTAEKNRRNCRRKRDARREWSVRRKQDDGRENILVVDDEQMIREALTSYLEKQGCHVFQAETGQEALQVFQRESVSFVILDLMLPDFSGEEVCIRILQRVSGAGHYADGKDHGNRYAEWSGYRGG